MSELLNIALIAALIIQALFYQFTIHRLINKLMAKSLSEYTSTIDRVALEEINLKKQLLIYKNLKKVLSSTQLLNQLNSW